MDKLHGMRAFVEIVDRGSLTAAAEAMERSLPAMVRTLAALEASLGVVLLRRTTRRMSLTDEGRLYLDRCRRILADVEEAEALVSTGHSEPRGLLRVTAPVLFGQMHVAPAVVTFLGRHAQMRVRLVLLDRVVDLVEEGLDVAVRIGPLHDSTMIAVPAGSMRRVLVAAPRFLRKHGTPDHPSALSQLPCVHFIGTAASANWRFQDGGRLVTVPVHGALSTNQAAVAIEACAAGMGFGVFLAYQVAPLVAARKLRIVLRDFEAPAVPVSLVYPDGRLASARLRAFLDWMKPRLRKPCP